MYKRQGLATVSSNGDYSFDPGADFQDLALGETRDVTFTYEVEDNNGAKSQAIVTITVTGINDAPIAVDDNYTTNEDMPLSGDIFTNDSDLDGDTLQVNTTPVVGPTNGTVQLNTDGTFTYTPDVDFNGTDLFIYEISDANGGTDEAVASITITAVNDAPAGTSNTVTTPEDTDYIFVPADFGFADINDDNAFLAINVDNLPGNGQLLLNGSDISAGDSISVIDITLGDLVFRPQAQGNGASYASFDFRVQDDGGTANGGNDTDSTPGTITINVTNVSDAPSGSDTTITTQEDTDYTFASNDFGFTDLADGNALSFVTITSLPDIGTLLHQGLAVNNGDTINGASLDAGDLVYQPPLN